MSAPISSGWAHSPCTSRTSPGCGIPTARCPTRFDPGLSPKWPKWQSNSRERRRRCCCQPDTEKAAQLRDEDDAVDAEHRHLFTLLIDHKWQNGVCSAVDVALLGRFYERFADHAVEIGRRVVFEATGGLPMHKQLA